MNDGKYPIVLDGELCGALDVSHRGAMTVFSARCRMRDELLRLSVYDDDSEGYLGVMIPENGELCLERALSPMAMRAFPREIIEVDRAGHGRASAFEAQNAELAGDKTNDEKAKSARAADSNVKEPDPENIETAENSGEIQPESAENSGKPAESTEIPDDDGLGWYSSPDGILVTGRSGCSFAALPEGDERLPRGIRGLARRIEGRNYLVFEINDGRLSDTERI